jgi:hypothetical protein
MRRVVQHGVGLAAPIGVDQVVGHEVGARHAARIGQRQRRVPQRLGLKRPPQADDEEAAAQAIERRLVRGAAPQCVVEGAGPARAGEFAHQGLGLGVGGAAQFGLVPEVAHVSHGAAVRHQREAALGQPGPRGAVGAAGRRRLARVGYGHLVRPQPAVEARAAAGGVEGVGVQRPGLRLEVVQGCGRHALHAGSSGRQKKAIVRTSMLSRFSAPGGVSGCSNAVWPMKRARPSVSES